MTTSFRTTFSRDQIVRHEEKKVEPGILHPQSMPAGALKYKHSNIQKLKC